MSHDLCLFSRSDEFPLIGNPDADSLGRAKVFCGNATPIIEWYEQHCRDLGPRSEVDVGGEAPGAHGTHAR
jgi:hypothetical protein